MLIATEEFGHVAIEHVADGGRDVAVLCEIAPPRDPAAPGPDALEVRRPVSGAGEDMVAAGVENPFEQGRCGVLLVRLVPQHLRRHFPLGRVAVKVDPHPLVKFAVKRDVAGEQLVEVRPGKTAKLRLGLNDLGGALVGERLDAQEDRDRPGVLDGDRVRGGGPRSVRVKERCS